MTESRESSSAKGGGSSNQFSSGPDSAADKDARRERLLKVLLENQVISTAQAQLALADQEVTDMSFEEVLLARHWVDQATLDRLAPWLKSAPESEAIRRSPAGSRDYKQNLKEYIKLMEKILGMGWE